MNKETIRLDIKQLKNLVKYYIDNKKYNKAVECEKEIKELEKKIK